jgi:hypothetical protein
MSMKRFLAVLFALTLLAAVACGGGEKTSAKDDGEDDGAEPTATAASTAGTPAAAPAAAAVAADAATITGSVKFEGAAAKPAIIQMSADPYCQSQHPAPVPDEDVVLSPTGQLANVFVYVKDVKGTFPTPASDALIDQKGCQYHPHVQGVQVGQTLDIRNSDATLHNIHALPVVNNQFNEGQPVQGMVSKKKFDKVEETPFKMKCDVHGWMHSYMAVMPHPFFAVSAADGSFTIPNLPPGQYTLVAWHEKYGTQQQQITVAPKEAKSVAFTFKG